MSSNHAFCHAEEMISLQINYISGRSPGLVVMGDDSSLRGRGFKSRRRILDGHHIFFTFICCKNYIVSLKRQKIKEKVAGVGSFF